MNYFSTEVLIDPLDENPPVPYLAAHHLVMLKASSISDQVIRERGYKTVTDESELRVLGFSPSQCRVLGLLIPLNTTDGSIGSYVYRPDNPRTIRVRHREKSDGTQPSKMVKYEIPKGSEIEELKRSQGDAIRCLIRTAAQELKDPPPHEEDASVHKVDLSIGAGDHDEGKGSHALSNS
jgi:hypothetical protein